MPPSRGACCCCCAAAADGAVEPLERRYGGRLLSDPATTVPQIAAQPQLDDFELLGVLGRGSYGRVLQVRKRDTGEVFAMKVMSKTDLIRRNQIRHALTERTLLQAMQHPFIVPLCYAFQSESSLHLILELQAGGELFFHLRREGAFAESRVRLYAAEILLALEALHSAGYVYRDLKPENVLLDAAGHVRLSDFGLAREAVAASDASALTFCGTPSYMAPEVLRGTGHGMPVDWWSFGTLIYEMLAGVPPFYSQNLHEMYRAILTAELGWPPRMGRAARALLEGLLQRDPRRRLGAHGSAKIRRASFFRRVHWQRVLRRGYPPSFIPMLRGDSTDEQALDVTNFDAAFTAEDVHLEEGCDGAPPASEVSHDGVHAPGGPPPGAASVSGEAQAAAAEDAWSAFADFAPYSREANLAATRPSGQ